MGRQVPTDCHQCHFRFVIISNLSFRLDIVAFSTKTVKYCFLLCFQYFIIVKTGVNKLEQCLNSRTIRSVTQRQTIRLLYVSPCLLVMFRFFGIPANNTDGLFQDPAVQQVARSTNNATQGLDDYNPFDGQQNANQATVNCYSSL